MFKLFALGSNGSGQLGIGHQTDTSTPQLCKFDDKDVEDISEDDSIRKIVAGGNHTLLLLQSGAVFASGSNEQGQCYLHSWVAQTSVFKRLIVPDRHHPAEKSARPTFVDISATWEASFLLDTYGRVYAFGTGQKGELGRGDRLTATGLKEDAPLPSFSGDSKITNLHSGMRHTIAISEDGEVYGWGSCRKGELGANLAHHKQVWSPRKLSVPFACQEAVLGRNFSIFFGSSNCDVFSQDESLQSIADLKDLPFSGATAGWSTAYTVDNDRVRAFGRNDRGQWPPEDLPDLCCLAAGSEHCVGLTKSGHAVAWGWGEHGNCGQPTDAHGNVAGKWNVLSIPLDAENEAITNVAAGCATSFLIVSKLP